MKEIQANLKRLLTINTPSSVQQYYFELQVVLNFNKGKGVWNLSKNLTKKNHLRKSKGHNSSSIVFLSTSSSFFRRQTWATNDVVNNVLAELHCIRWHSRYLVKWSVDSDWQAAKHYYTIKHSHIIDAHPGGYSRSDYLLKFFIWFTPDLKFVLGFSVRGVYLYTSGCTCKL